MPAFLTKIVSYLMIAFYTIIPTFTASYVDYKPADDDVLFTAALVSDTHLDHREYVLQGTFSYGLKHINKIGSDIDALVVTGDITNYGDVESLDTYYKLLGKYSPTKNIVTVSGNHDIGHVEDRDHDTARADFISKLNAFMGTDYENIYYTTTINGYKFIVLGDEGERWDHFTISDEQKAFLDAELKASENDGKPVFVCCHWPMQGENGEPVVWDESGVQDQIYHVREIVEKYHNVFWLSGHMHEGLNSSDMTDRLGVRWANTTNGVNYVNLPTYGLVNQYGVFWPASGAIMEVYSDRVVFRARNYLTGKEIANCSYTFTLENEVA